jgi:hypothetical protein
MGKQVGLHVPSCCLPAPHFPQPCALVQAMGTIGYNQFNRIDTLLYLLVRLSLSLLGNIQHWLTLLLVVACRARLL